MHGAPTSLRTALPHPSPGTCADAIDASSCRDAKAGNASLADCISGLLAARDAGGSEEGGGDEAGAWRWGPGRCMQHAAPAVA